MNDRASLGRIAMRSALQLRRMLSIPREGPVNVYDIATALGIEVRFVDIPSLEGMFYREPNPKILLPSWQHRPKGRIAYSCAHEMGHCQLGHGTQVDRYIERPRDQSPKPDEEFAADVFAASLMMPRQAVLSLFSRRGWDILRANPTQLFIIAGELDVGYTTLLRHLRYGLEIVDDGWLTTRINIAPKAIRQELSGNQDAPRIIVVDEHWSDVTIDVEVGDEIIIPSHLPVNGGSLVVKVIRNGDYASWVACRAGETAVRITNRNHRVRIARTDYCGLLKYRFLDDPDEA
ncbi:MAG: ImmA/IrrE family metallo-endopeptidase [Candidatus Binatia bacterium]